MSVLVDLEPEVEELLKKKAAARGSQLDEYAARVLRKHAVLDRNYEEVMSPLWKAFEETRMTEEELNELIDREKKAIREERTRPNEADK